MTRNPEPRHVEDALREIVDKAALLRYFTAVRLGVDVPDHSVLSGLGDVCSEIEEMARAVKRSIPVGALMEPIIGEDDAEQPLPRRSIRSRPKRRTGTR